MKITFGIAVLMSGLVITSCSTETVSKPKEKRTVVAKNKQSFLGPAEHLLEPKKQIVDKKSFPNGLRIQWFNKGTGELLNNGEVVELNYKVKLDNGDVVDGNHLLKREMIPYLVGYNLQTPGWDIAMRELRVGDFVEVVVPANLARGKKGIKGLIPPNAPNILFIRVGKKVEPTRNIDGVKVWCLQSSPDANIPKVTEKSAVGVHFFVGTASNPKYDNSYQRNAPFRFRMDDFGLVPGLKKALLGSALFDKLWVLVPAKEAYGSKGYLNLVKPNETIFYDLFVTELDGNK